MSPVYSCEFYQIKDRVLIITNPIICGWVKDLAGFEKLKSTMEVTNPDGGGYWCYPEAHSFLFDIIILVED